MAFKTYKNRVNSKLGKACVPGMVNSGYAFVVLGILPIFSFSLSGYIGSVLLILFGLFLSLSTRGVDIDIESNSLKYYIKIFSIFKINKKIDIKPFEYISVLITNYNYVTYSRSNRAFSEKGRKHEVYLVDSSKTNRQIIASFTTTEHAVRFAKKMAVKLNKKYLQ